MHVFIIGITGRVGSLLASDLTARGDTVAGLVRKAEQVEQLRRQGLHPVIGDLTNLSPSALAEQIGIADAVVFSAGAAGSQSATTMIDGDAVTTTIAAAHLLPNPPRLGLVSVFPEAGRGSEPDADFEHYISVKKQADIAVTRSDLDYVIVRPSSLRNGPGTGTVALGPAQIHGTVTRADVAATLAVILHEPRISRQILELTAGDTPIAEAVTHNARP